MSPLESMAAGKQVVGVAEGGLLETVISEETGILFDPPPSIDAIFQAVETMTPQRALNMRWTCEAQASAFSDGNIFGKNAPTNFFPMANSQ